MWIHNDCSFITESQYEIMQNSNCAWICSKCDFFNFSDSFFDEQKLDDENRFNPFAKGNETKSPSTATIKNSSISGLKFLSININSIRGKKLELLAYLDFHQLQIVVIHETKIDSFIMSSELFPETFPYSVYRKDRNLNGGGVMLLIQKDILHMPITELENNSESVWVKVFANKTSYFVASWYRPPNDTLEKLGNFDLLFREQLDKIRNKHKGNKTPQFMF